MLNDVNLLNTTAQNFVFYVEEFLDMAERKSNGEPLPLSQSELTSKINLNYMFIGVDHIFKTVSLLTSALVQINNTLYTLSFDESETLDNNNIEITKENTLSVIQLFDKELTKLNANMEYWNENKDDMTEQQEKILVFAEEYLGILESMKIIMDGFHYPLGIKISRNDLKSGSVPTFSLDDAAEESVKIDEQLYHDTDVGDDDVLNKIIKELSENLTEIYSVARAYLKAINYDSDLYKFEDDIRDDEDENGESIKFEERLAITRSNLAGL